MVVETVFSRKWSEEKRGKKEKINCILEGYFKNSPLFFVKKIPAPT